MKKVVMVILFLFSTSVLAASNSNPGLYYGQKPTAAQWNSYFSSKLDYTPGDVNTIPYWDGSGSIVNATIIGDCNFNAGTILCPNIGSTTPGTGVFTKTTLSIGTLNPTATQGEFEFDGKAFYLTPTVSNRGVALSEHFVNNSAAQNGTNVATAQPWFVGTLTSGSIYLTGTNTYEFEGLLAVSTTGTTAHTLAVGFSMSGTLTSIAYTVSSTQNATSLATLSTSSSVFLTTAASTVVTASAATATYNIIEVKGTVRVNAAGNFTPQFTYSAAPGVAPIIAAGSFFRMRPLGDNTVTSVGNWN